MSRLWCALVCTLLASCAWNPVVTPYAYKGAAKVSTAETAVVWGFYDGTEMYFIEIDGKTLPSRGGAGRPISLALLPGTYTATVYFKTGEGQSADLKLPLTVEAGHTYVIENRVTPYKTHVVLGLKDLGTRTRCSYERYESFTGHAKLVCRDVEGP